MFPTLSVPQNNLRVFIFEIPPHLLPTKSLSWFVAFPLNRFGYIEFYDPGAVVGALAMQGYELMGHPVMVKVSEAEKNVVNTTVTARFIVAQPCYVLLTLSLSQHCCNGRPRLCSFVCGQSPPKDY